MPTTSLIFPAVQRDVHWLAACRWLGTRLEVGYRFRIGSFTKSESCIEFCFTSSPSRAAHCIPFPVDVSSLTKLWRLAHREFPANPAASAAYESFFLEKSVLHTMIKAVLIINNQGKPRFARFYVHVVRTCRRCLGNYCHGLFFTMASAVNFSVSM